MHTVHLPDAASKDAGNGFMAAALGIMFSIDNYSAELEDWQRDIIDQFFDSM